MGVVNKTAMNMAHLKAAVAVHEKPMDEACEECMGMAQELVGMTHEEMVGGMHEDMVGVAHEEVAGATLEEMVHEMMGVALEEMMGVAHEERVGMTHEILNMAHMEMVVDMEMEGVHMEVDDVKASMKCKVIIAERKEDIAHNGVGSRHEVMENKAHYKRMSLAHQKVMNMTHYH